MTRYSLLCRALHQVPMFFFSFPIQETQHQFVVIVHPKTSSLHRTRLWPFIWVRTRWLSAALSVKYRCWKSKNWHTGRPVQSEALFLTSDEAGVAMKIKRGRRGSEWRTRMNGTKGGCEAKEGKKRKGKHNIPNRVEEEGDLCLSPCHSRCTWN